MSEKKSTKKSSESKASTSKSKTTSSKSKTTTSKSKTTTSKSKTTTKSKKSATTKKSKTSKRPATKAKTAKPKKEDLKDIDDTLILNGISLIEENKLEAALECFEDFSKTYPQNPFGWYYLGYTKMLQDKKKDAMRHFKKATKLDKKFMPSLYYQGLIEFENNNFEKALKIFDDMMVKFSTDEIKESGFNIPYFVAICYHYLGNLERAEEFFLFAYNLSPEDPVVLYYKGFNELALRKYDFAIETFKNLLYIDINNQMFWDLFKGYSYFYHQQEDKKKAKEQEEKSD